jgi:hypothetical protein
VFCDCCHLSFEESFVYGCHGQNNKEINNRRKGGGDGERGEERARKRRKIGEGREEGKW